jgi:hypothetical protein
MSFISNFLLGTSPTPPSPLAPPGEGEQMRTADLVTAKK